MRLINRKALNAFYETSATNDLNVPEVFVDIAKEIIAKNFSDDDKLDVRKINKGGNI